jgi:hypothetical protein
VPKLTIELGEADLRRLGKLAAASGESAPACARAPLEDLLGAEAMSGRADMTDTVLSEETGSQERWPIWEGAIEAGKRFPAEERDQLPRDGSVNVDQYVYGLPRREPEE